MHTLLTNLSALGKVTVVALVFGAGLPIVFAFGVRWWSRGVTVGADGEVRRDLAATTAALVCFAVILAAVVTGILYTAAPFLSARFDIHLFGQS